MHFHIFFRTVFEALLSSIDLNIDQKRSFACQQQTGNHSIQYMVNNEIAYVSAATSQFHHTICFEFLRKLCEEFNYNLESCELVDLPLSQVKYELEKIIERNMTHYSESDEVGLRGVNKQIQDVMNITFGNIYFHFLFRFCEAK